MINLLNCLVASCISALLVGGIGLFACRIIGVPSAILLGIGGGSAITAYIAFYATGQSPIIAGCALIYAIGIVGWIKFITLSIKEHRRAPKVLLGILPRFTFWILLATLPLIPLFDTINKVSLAGGSLHYFNIAQSLYLNLPIDNFIPAALAKAVFDDTYQTPLIGDWLGSDRPPLQSGFIIMSFLAVRLLGFDWSTSSFSASIVANSIWLFGAAAFVSTLQFTKKLSCASIIPAGISGFIILNTTFTWPKAMAVGFLMACVATIDTNQDRSNLLKRQLIAGLLLGFACLSHGSSFFAIPAIAFFALWNLPWKSSSPPLLAIRSLFSLLSTFTAIQIPWIAWQKFVDPPGDRLLKWHLAGIVDISPESFTNLLINQYHKIGFSGFAQNKLANFKVLFGSGNHIILWNQILDRQYKEALETKFFVHSAAILTWILPTLFFMSALLLVNGKMISTSNLRFRAIIISFSIFATTIAFWSVVMFGPATTINYQGSGLTVIMPLLTVGTIFANMNLTIFLAGCCLQALGIFAIYGHNLSHPSQVFFIFCELAIIASAALIPILKSDKDAPMPLFP